MPGDRDKLETNLFTELARLRTRMEEIYEHGGCQDPDQVMADIEAETAMISKVVEQIVSDLSACAPVQTDVNRTVREATRALMIGAAFPVVVHTNLNPSLPRVQLPPDLARAILTRAMQITSEHQGPGSELSVETSSFGDDVVVELSVRRATVERRRPMPLKLRAATLVELLHRVGGRVELEDSDDLVRMTLRIAHAVPTP